VGQMPIVGVNGSTGAQPVSMNMTISQKSLNGTAAAVSGPGGGRSSGYGY
jgi:ATF/CREB family transcription factor